MVVGGLRLVKRRRAAFIGMVILWIALVLVVCGWGVFFA